MTRQDFLLSVLYQVETHDAELVEDLEDLRQNFDKLVAGEAYDPAAVCRYAVAQAALWADLATLVRGKPGLIARITAAGAAGARAAGYGELAQ